MIALLSSLLLVLSACSRTGDPTQGAAPPAATAATSTTPPDPSRPAVGDTSTASTEDPDPTSATTAADPDPGAPTDHCRGLVAAAVGVVSTAELTEVSGLAASQAHPGVIWAHNDSGHDTALHALARDGSPQGRVAVTGEPATDPEDLDLVGGMIHLADIGDNNGNRPHVAVLRFPEPDPGADRTEAVDRIELRYPDGPRDAEALAVDPLTGQVVIVAKTLAVDLGAESLVGPGPAGIYVADLPVGSGSVDLVRAGEVALDRLDELDTGVDPEGVIARFGVGGVATALDISADGRVVALRTYRTVWLFDRPPGRTVAEALAGEPCEAPTRAEAQGESVAFLDDGTAGFVTVSEGAGAAVNLTSAG